MDFVTSDYYLWFLPIVFFLTFTIGSKKRRRQIGILMASSYVFFWLASGWHIILLITSTLLDWTAGKRIHESDDQKIRKRWLVGSLVVNLGILAIFKYLDFFIESLNWASLRIADAPSIDTFGLLLPVGISFYTFQTMSYTIDIYRKKNKPYEDLLSFACYAAFFPQLVAGPILRTSDFFNNNLKPKLNDNNHDFINGFNRICLGLFLKLCLADELANFNDLAFDYNFKDLSFLDTWTMAFGFGLQIYFDFSAYSHMAIGVSKVIGLNIKENFIFPYSSISSTEFWRRWHISLSSWVADYLYKFLNKNLPIYFYGSIPLLLTWGIMGLWHGSSERFFIWGLLNGFFILIHRMVKDIDFKFLKIITKN